MTNRKRFSSSATAVSISLSMLLLIAIALMYIVGSVPLDILGDIEKLSFSWHLLPLIAVFQIIFLFVAVEIWRRIVKSVTGHTSSISSAYAQLVSVSIGKYVPGKVWGFVARSGEMYRQNIPVHLSVISSIVEQATLLAGCIVVASGAAIFLFPQQMTIISAAAILLLVLFMVVLKNVPIIAHWTMTRKNLDIGDMRLSSYHPIALVRFVLAYSFLWVLSGATFCAIYISVFDTAISIELIAALVLANTLGIVLGFFAFFVPGGLGVREAIATGVLASYVPVREALFVAVAYRAWLMAVDVLNAIYVFSREAHMVRRQIPGKENQEI